MHVILTAEDGFGKMLDEFEREFQKLREEVKDVKEDINRRQEMLKVINQKSANSIMLRNKISKNLTNCQEHLTTIKSQLRQQKKKYSEEEMANKNDRIQRVADNLEVLNDLFTHQDEIEQRKIGMKLLTDDDIERQMVFKNRRQMNSDKPKNYDIDEDDENAFRDLNEYEQGLLAKFEDNDKEID